MYQTTRQLRGAPLLDLERHPAVVPVFFSDLIPNEDGMYPEQDFMNLLQDAIEEYDRMIEDYDLANAA